MKNLKLLLNLDIVTIHQVKNNKILRLISNAKANVSSSMKVNSTLIPLDSLKDSKPNLCHSTLNINPQKNT